jgi:predicted component of type VI protein secretion system
MLELIRLDPGSPSAPIAVTAGLRVGRHPNCDLVLEDASISRLHAKVEERAGEFVLVDAGSTNGLWIDGRRVALVPLELGRRFAIGKLEFEVAGAGSGPAPEGLLDEPLDFDADLDLAVQGGERSATGGLELEDPAEIDLGGTAVTERPAGAASPSGPGPAQRTAGPAQRTAGPAQRTAGPAARNDDPSQRDDLNLRRAALLSEVADDRRGLLRGDLTQYPASVQALVWIGVLGTFAAAIWLALNFVRG